jgi:hypothetical protein
MHPTRGDALHRPQGKLDGGAGRPGIEEIGPALGDEGEADGGLHVQARGDDEAGDQRVLGGAVDAQVSLGLGERDRLDGGTGGEDEGHGSAPSELRQ